MALLTAFTCARSNEFVLDPAIANQGTVINGAGKGVYGALATVKQDEAGRCYLYFSESVKLLYPVPFTHQYRAMCMCHINGRSDVEDYYSGEVLWIEELEEGGFTLDASVTGADGLEILDDWTTNLSDGYLSLKYKTWWGEHPVKHDFYVVAGIDENDPYCIELRQDSHSDPHFIESEGIICFDLNALPDTDGEIRTLKLIYTDTEGNKANKYFEFKTRK